MGKKNKKSKTSKASGDERKKKPLVTMADLQAMSDDSDDDSGFYFWHAYSRSPFSFSFLSLEHSFLALKATRKFQQQFDDAVQAHYRAFQIRF